MTIVSRSACCRTLLNSSRDLIVQEYLSYFTCRIEDDTHKAEYLALATRRFFGSENQAIAWNDSAVSIHYDAVPS